MRSCAWLLEEPSGKTSPDGQLNIRDIASRSVVIAVERYINAARWIDIPIRSGNACVSNEIIDHFCCTSNFKQVLVRFFVRRRRNALKDGLALREANVFSATRALVTKAYILIYDNILHSIGNTGADAA